MIPIVNAREEQYQEIELFGKPALFTNSRIDRDTIPENLHCYDLRGSDNDPGRPTTIEPHVVVNHAGSVLTHEPVKFRENQISRRLRDELNFVGGMVSLEEFCEEHGIEYLPDSSKFKLRPASVDEAGLFYTQEEKDAELATVGHMRFDHGHGGNEFWTTWWPHNDDEFNTPEFKSEFQSFVDELREKGPLKNLSTMSNYCYSHNGELDASSSGSYGYIAESENYRYCLRCTPRSGDYSYIYIYDKRQQELNMKSSGKPIIARSSYANGDASEHTDAEAFLAELHEELPYRNNSGFRYEVLTDDPAIRKAADDILYDLFGEDDPRQLEDYENKPEQGMTMGGM